MSFWYDDFGSKKMHAYVYKEYVVCVTTIVNIDAEPKVVFTVTHKTNDFSVTDRVILKNEVNVIKQIKRSVCQKHDKKIREIIYSAVLNKLVEKFVTECFADFATKYGL